MTYVLCSKNNEVLTLTRTLSRYNMYSNRYLIMSIQCNFPVILVDKKQVILNTKPKNDLL